VTTGVAAVRVGDMHQSDAKAIEAIMQHIQPLLPTPRMLVLAGERSDCVYCDVAEVDGGFLLQFINYNAKLHPDMSEMEQQKADRTIPARNLRVRFRPPKGKELVKLTMKAPGMDDHELEVRNNTFIIPELMQYAAVIAVVE